MNWLHPTFLIKYDSDSTRFGKTALKPMMPQLTSWLIALINSEREKAMAHSKYLFQSFHPRTENTSLWESLMKV